MNELFLQVFMTKIAQNIIYATCPKKRGQFTFLTLLLALFAIAALLSLYGYCTTMQHNRKLQKQQSHHQAHYRRKNRCCTLIQAIPQRRVGRTEIQIGIEKMHHKKQDGEPFLQQKIGRIGVVADTANDKTNDYHMHIDPQHSIEIMRRSKYFRRNFELRHTGHQTSHKEASS